METAKIEYEKPAEMDSEIARRSSRDVPFCVACAPGGLIRIRT